MNTKKGKITQAQKKTFTVICDMIPEAFSESLNRNLKSELVHHPSIFRHMLKLYNIRIFRKLLAFF